MKPEMPNVAIFQYNLACYECQLGDLEKAKATLQNAINLEPSMSMMALDLATERGDPAFLFACRLYVFCNQSRCGQWMKAEASWQLLDPMGRQWRRTV